MYSKYPFTLDIHAAMSQVSIPVTVGDTARRLYIGLTDGGEPFIIPDGYRAVLTAEKADGTHLLNDCIIEQSGAVIRYDFTEQTASAVGRVGCQVKLYGSNGEVLAEPRFTIVVYEGYADDDIISEDEKTAIDAMIIAEQQRVAAEANREIVTQRAEAAAERANEAADRIDESVKGDKAYIAYAYHDETVDGVYYTEWARGMNYIGVYTGVKAPSKKTDYEWSVFSPGVYVGGGEMPDYADIQIDPDSEDIDYVVVQETGDSEVSVMSQKATTEAIEQASGNTQILANALKGTATGEAVGMHDVSPLPHEMAVKVSGVEDISAVKVMKYGKNLFSPNAPMVGSISDVYTPSLKVERLDSGCRISTSADHTATTEKIAYQVIPIDMVRGKTITLSFKRYSEVDDTKTSTCAIVQVADTELEGDYTYKGGSLNNRLSYKEIRMKDAVDGYFAVTFTVPQTETRKNLFILFYIGEGAVMTQGGVVEYHDIQVEIDGKATDFSPYITPTEYTPNADGTVDGVTALHPTTTLMTDTEGAVLDVGYNRDINKAFAALESVVNALVGG
jgi:hypothetical protein